MSLKTLKAESRRELITLNLLRDPNVIFIPATIVDIIHIARRHALGNIFKNVI